MIIKTIVCVALVIILLVIMAMFLGALMLFFIDTVLDMVLGVSLKEFLEGKR